MKSRNLVIAAAMAIALSLLAGPQQGYAQEDSGSPFGIGVQSSWPAYGISGLYDMSEQITLQGIVGALGTWTTLAARGIYRFQTADKYDLFGFGTAGLWSYDYGIDRENSLAIGGGAGVELDWREILEDDSFPPLYSNIDISFILANFDYYNFSGLSIGGGIHYRF